MAILLLASLAVQDDLGASLKKLFEGLSAAQRESALKSYDDESRDAEVPFPGPRSGLLIGDLSDAQFETLDGAIRQFLSEDGYRSVMKVAAQCHKKEGLRAYYAGFFGDPTGEGPWAFRIVEHHLTLVHVHSDPDRFGQILLGANPPELWHEQEDAALAGFKALSAGEKKRAVLDAGEGESGAALGDRGVALRDLSEEARKAAHAMIDARIGLFSDAQQKKLRTILDGRDDLLLAFFGEMTARSADGGRANWKIEAPGFLCDYESSRGHIHMTLRATGKTTDD